MVFLRLWLFLLLWQFLGISASTENLKPKIFNFFVFSSGLQCKFIEYEVNK